MKRIAVLTSGGDAPGMNAAIRAVVRAGIDFGMETYGVRHGYAGLIAGDFLKLSARDVGGIMQKGGTMLGSARCLEFEQEEGRKQALARLSEAGIEGVVVIGGNGSQTGSHALHKLGFPVAGVASTIDNDLYGSDITIGVDTALNIALEAIDRLKNTASSHQRAFLLEVMGRNCGYLALTAAVAGGAEAVVLPEYDMDPEQVVDEIRKAYEVGKPHAIIIVAEGCRYNAHDLVKYFHKHRKRLGYQLRATVLGHVQRGGNPGAFDRILGTRLGAAAVRGLAEGENGFLVGLVKGEIRRTPLDEVVSNKKKLDPEMLELARVMAK